MLQKRTHHPTATRSSSSAKKVRLSTSKPINNVESSPPASGKNRAEKVLDATPEYVKRWYTKPAEKLARKSADAYFRNTFWKQENSLPRCYTCRRGQKPMPVGNNRPDGREGVDLLPCGCGFKEAIIEQFLVENEILKPKSKKKGAPAKEDSNGPKQLGISRPTFVAFFELLFGDLTPSKLNEQDISKWVEALEGAFGPKLA